MYCRYTKTSILDHKQCPLDGSKFFIGSVLYQRFHCIVFQLHLNISSYQFPRKSEVRSTCTVAQTEIYQHCCRPRLRPQAIVVFKYN